MEILLAVVVASAVIFFGALISMGNERQRKAIDSLREQLELWAMQDLRIKRERLSCEVRVDDPREWLNKVATKVLGLDLGLQMVESYEELPVLLCMSDSQKTRVLFSPLSPGDIKRMKQQKHNRLLHFSNINPILTLPRNVFIYEVSILNAGIMFDVELRLAWKSLTGKNIERLERMWIYRI